LKLGGGLMMVKASGSLLKDATARGRGFVAVDYLKVREFFLSCPNSAAAESRSGEVIAAATGSIGKHGGRASIEAGFHSLLGRCVVHTHSVYANVVACSRGGGGRLEQLGSFGGSPIAWVPYARPGFQLTRQVAAVMAQHQVNYGREPAVLLLQNHGLIVSAASPKRAAELHERVNRAFRKTLGVTEDFPPVRLRPSGRGVFVDKSGYLNDHLQRRGATGRYFVEKVICPDQIVYGCGGFSYKKTGREPIFVDSSSGSVYYKGTEKEAAAAAETLTSVAYVLDQVDKLGWQPSYLSPAKIKAVLGMDAEKYRQQLLKKQ
jgi:hypothetical protein